MQWRREIMSWKQLMVIQMCDTRQLAYKIVNSMDLNGNVQGAKMKAMAMRKLGQHMFAIDSFEFFEN